MTDDDKDLFRRMMASVKPLKNTKKLVEKPTVDLPVKRSKQPMPNETPTSNYNLSNHYQTTIQGDTTLSFSIPGIPHKRLLQLRKGEIRWQARLDMHGLRPDAASESLCHFIEQQLQLAHRCVLIIHGKGGRHGESPILKNLVNHWLPQLPQVLAFHSALARDGGNGALYVLLKKSRDND